MRTAAVMPAAGTGARMNRAVPKQYLPLGGKPIIIRTLQSLERIPIIDAVFPVIDAGELEFFSKEAAAAGLKKTRPPVPGGTTRQESVYSGLKAAGEEFEIILVHDAVRPFLEEEAVMEIIAQAELKGAAAAAVPVSDTLKRADEKGFITVTVPREGLWAVQTPQAFRRELILEAHETAIREGYRGTDDASLVERMGRRVKIVEGSPWNIKITTPEDFVTAEGILRELGL